MADTTLLLDDPMSSPDPLADEIPSSVQSKARRIAMPHHDYSMGAARSSSPLKSPTKSSTKGRSVSPRKRTFELDVGNEATPQRILVTVEADETMRPGINRRLFPPSSPTRKVVRAEEITTRKVPLRGLSDDEGFGDDATTPRKRGRPRKSNGTPVPKTRKRAGTPLKPIGDATRPRLDLQSEASMFSDISIINDGEIRGSTPKPKPRARKTPAKRAPTPSAAIPSSEIPPEKQTTGRKRGRPRKALMPEEVAEIVMAESELDLPEMVDDEPVPAAVETARVADDVRYSIEGLNDRSSDRATEPPIDEGIGVESDAPSRMSSESMSPVPPELTILDPIFEESVGASREPADQQQQQYGEAERDANSEGVPTSDGYAPLMEPDDDGYSDNGTVESANPARQDTLTHASDFSMIAVESLPSFQASFHGNLSRITEDLNEPAELGEATNMMINQTLETLRRSIQNDNSGGDSDEEGSKGDDEASAARRGSSVGSSGGRHMRGPPARNRSAWSSSPLGSPKRRKPLPLSRQMLVGKARQADDSFSSVPDSVLNAATPARFRPQQTKAETQHQEPEEHLYEDSFSEIPDAVLEAATPAPARKISRDVPSGLQSSPLTREDLPDREADLGQERNKLPTPDGNSSSNVNPQRSGQENQELSAPRRSNSFSQSRTQIPSSPPDILVERYESLEPRPESQKRDPHREIPESPQLASYSGIGQEESSRNLEAPTSAQRPTLSPIVRVARTLQSVMSDKSSPEGLDSNLRSPFRGSHSRQSSIAKSPTPFSNDPFSRSNTNQVAPAAGATSAPPRESRPSLSQSIRSSSNRDAAHALNDPFGPQINSGQQSQTSKAQSTPPRRATPDRGSSVGSGLVTSSTKNLLPSDDQMSWGPDESPLRARSITRQSITRALRESSLAASQPRRPPQKSPLQLARDGERAPLRSTQLPRSLDNDSGDEILLDVDNDDIWEVEASRPEIQEPTIAAATAEADHPSTGRLRGKIPNPQRNSIRNEAYQDERESPSQLLLDESPQKMPVAQQTRGEHEYEDEDVEDDDIEEVPRHLPLDEGEQLPSPPALQQRKAPDVPLKRADGSDYSLLQDRSDSARIPSERSLEFVNVEEYSLIAPQTRQTGSVNNRVHPVAAVEDEHSLVAPEGNARPEPTPARSRLFGGFDIMSFFSSPSALPKEDATGKAERVNATRNKAQATQPIPAVKKAQSSLWSAGLFPSIAQKEFRPSPERGNNLLSSSAPPSSPIRAEESSPTPTPTPREAPSTPERQSYPAIEQKRDFTPRSGQNGSTLFTGSAVNAARTNTTRPPGSVMFLNVPDDRQDHDTSIATQESDYERVPPRKIPSRWDKTLSPSKSSFRSPMKATTPGRVVAFSRSVVLPPPPPPPARVPELSEAESTAPPRPQNNTSKHVFLHPPPSLLQPPQIPDQSDQENDLRSKSAANTAASRSQPPRPGSVAAAAAPVASATKAAQLSRFPQPKAFALTGNTWTKSHWVRFDEILQLRRKNPRQFRRDHPNASIPGHAANDPVYCSDDDEGSNDEDAELHSFSTRNSSCRKILGKQVSSQGESMLVEPWHLEVVSAFMQELNPCPWDERVLVKRLFALIVGEERRKHASVRPSLTKGRGQADQRVELGTRHR